MALSIKRYTDSGNTEILDGHRPVAASRNGMLFIFASTPLETAIEAAERYGRRFGSVLYGDWNAWFPAVEEEPEWAC